MKDNEYTCSMCGGTFEKAWSDEEAWEEHDRNFPGSPRDDACIVCDDCYKKMIRERPAPGMGIPWWRFTRRRKWRKGARLFARGVAGMHSTPDIKWFGVDPAEPGQDRTVVTPIVKLSLKKQKIPWWRFRRRRQVKEWLVKCEAEVNKMMEKSITDLFLYGVTSWKEPGEIYGRSPLIAGLPYFRRMNDTLKREGKKDGDETEENG